jgi:hypothetical protein
MSLVKKPFVNYRLEEERNDEVEVISLKVNKEERLLLERLMRLTNYNQSKVIKISLGVLEKVILNNFGSDLFMKLTSSERSKPIFEKEKEVTQLDKK